MADNDEKAAKIKKLKRRARSYAEEGDSESEEKMKRKAKRLEKDDS
jgi:hypothetical protein